MKKKSNKYRSSIESYLAKVIILMLASLPASREMFFEIKVVYRQLSVLGSKGNSVESVTLRKIYF